MSVVVTAASAKRWKTKVPYTITTDIQNIAKNSIAEINEAVGFDLLVEKASTDTAYLKIKTVAEAVGSSKSIGYRNEAIGVTANTQETMIHELLHALGFGHEQYHKDYPWADGNKTWNYTIADSFDPRTQAAYEKSGIGTNDTLFAKIVATGYNKMQATGQLIYRHTYLADNNFESIDNCDADSVMMYPPMKSAVESAQITTTSYNETGKFKAGKSLSRGDQAALVAMYRNLNS